MNLILIISQVYHTSTMIKSDMVSDLFNFTHFKWITSNNLSNLVGKLLGFVSKDDTDQRILHGCLISARCQDSSSVRVKIMMVTPTNLQYRWMKGVVLCMIEMTS